MDPWKRYEAEVACPTCDAPVGSRCDLPDDLVHPARMDAWVALDPANRETDIEDTARTSRGAAREVWCPRCGARPGRPCWGATGKRSSPHLDRHAAAAEAEAAQTGRYPKPRR